MKEEVMEQDYDQFKGLMALWKSMPQEMDVETDYKRFDELLVFWKSMPQAMHVSWHEALETASALPEGKRSLSRMQHLVAKARSREKIDCCDLDLKFQQRSSKWSTIIEEGDLEQEIPLTFGRLLGMKEPENPTNGVWQSYFLPLATTRQMVSVCELVNDILHLMHVGQRSLGYEMVQEAVWDRFGSFKCEMYWLLAWRQKWRFDFLELFTEHPTDEMRAKLGQEFCDWVKQQDDWLWSDDVLHIWDHLQL
ncbi:hypothetical protein GGI35DRAFT_492097 [Trichoderma velutinum]